jgi:hypothetical protein
MLRWVWNYIKPFIVFLMLAVNAHAQDVSGSKLAVINTAGEVWARDLGANTIGLGAKLTGPGLFGAPDDQFVVASEGILAVVTKSGEFWPRQGTDATISQPLQLSGSLFDGSDAKYVLFGGGCFKESPPVYVVNTSGEVWSHYYSSTTIGSGTKLNGLSLFGAPNDKYVVLDTYRILVINTAGEVWVHDLSNSNPHQVCPYDTVGTGYKLSGPGLFGAPNDKYVVSLNTILYVINNLGEVWAHSMSVSTIGGGVKLSGLTLFGAPNDKYVVTYLLP